MFWRLRKFVLAAANLALIVVMIKLFRNQLDWDLALGCLALSAVRIGLTTATLRDTFTNYFDWQFRLKFRMSVYTGLALAVVACWAGGFQLSLSFAPANFHVHLGPVANSNPWIYGLAFLELVLWWGLWRLYRRNRHNYKMTNHGRMRADLWINPPADVLDDGTAIVTNGTFAPDKENPLGHGEVVFTDTDGVKKFLSCWIKTGLIVNDMLVLIGKWLKGKHHYIAFRLRQPLTAEKRAEAAKIVAEMKADNLAWVAKVMARRKKWIAWLPIPKAWKERLLVRFTPTGYSWLGLISGFRFRDHWTCFGSVLELYNRLGVRTYKYGVGVLAMGTGLFDQLNPAQLLHDTNFEVLTVHHEAYYKQNGKLPPTGWTPSASAGGQS